MNARVNSAVDAAPPRSPVRTLSSLTSGRSPGATAAQGRHGPGPGDVQSFSLTPSRSDLVVLASLFGQVRIKVGLGSAGVSGGCLNIIGKLNVGVVPYGR